MEFFWKLLHLKLFCVSFRRELFLLSILFSLIVEKSWDKIPADLLRLSFKSPRLPNVQILFFSSSIAYDDPSWKLNLIGYGAQYLAVTWVRNFSIIIYLDCNFGCLLPRKHCQRVKIIAEQLSLDAKLVYSVFTIVGDCSH